MSCMLVLCIIMQMYWKLQDLDTCQHTPTHTHTEKIKREKLFQTITKILNTHKAVGRALAIYKYIYTIKVVRVLV